MPECGVCGGSEFTPHDGFYYCTVCQTQSQDLRQQEMSFKLNSSYGFLKKTSKPKQVREKKRAERLGEGPAWTSWQAFNFMLRGMTEEMIALGAPTDFEKVVLQLWACYLRVNEVAFTSVHQSVEPKLGWPFRYRDGKVLYDIDSCSKLTAKIEERVRKKPTKTKKSKKYKLRYSSRKMHMSDYESHASDVQSQDEMNLTLESLASSSNTDTSKKLKTPRRKHMTVKAAKKQTRSVNSANLLYRTNLMINRLTLLCIIHIALIITHSQIQLSDLFRFIREGHLSFSVLSHFLPAELKFGCRDCKYVNADADNVMPTHWNQRRHLNLVSAMLKFRALPSPDFVKLVKRYALDLLLPEQLSDMAVRLMQLRGTPDEITRPAMDRPMVSFELVALTPLLVVMKLLFGLDGVTERHSSYFAETVNRLSSNQLFSWCQWQKAMECRKAVFSVWHYPTREMVVPDTVLDAKLGLRFLKTIHKDPHIRERKHKGAKSPHYVMPMALVNKIEKVLEEIIVYGDRDPAPTFRPSLTPGITLVQDLVSWLNSTGQPDPPWLNILAKDWSSFHIDYLLDPNSYLQVLQENGKTVDWQSCEWLRKHMSRAVWIQDKLDGLNDNQQANQVPATIVSHTDQVKKGRRVKPHHLLDRPNDNMFLRSDHNYWRLLPADEVSHRETPWPYKTFNTDVMPQFPSSWSWLLTLCSQMLHITPRDIYMEVLAFEDDLMQITGAS